MKRLKKWWRNWKRRRDYNSLSERHKGWAKLMGLDLETLEKLDK